MVPPPLDNLHLDFDTQDEKGNFYTAEGQLRYTVLPSTSSNNVVAAKSESSNRKVVHGASSMAGEGKTTALIARGHDQAIRLHFQDGVLYMALGADASVKHISESLAEMMKFTGAIESAEAVRNEKDLAKAVMGAACWFRGRRNVFLFDDIWPMETCTQGYLGELCNILTGSPDSRIAVTTRSRDIGSSIGSYVDFGARDMDSSGSIFMRLATNGSRGDDGVQELHLL